MVSNFACVCFVQLTKLSLNVNLRLCSTGTYFSWEALAVAVAVDVGMLAGKVSLKHDVCEVKDEYSIF